MKNLEEIKTFAAEVASQKGYRVPVAFGIARVTRGVHGKTIAANFATVNYKESALTAATLVWALQENGIDVDFSDSECVCALPQSAVKSALDVFGCLLGDIEKHPNVHALFEIDRVYDANSEFEVIFLFEDVAPRSVETVYLKLYLLSLGKAPIRSLNLDGAFSLMPNLAWDANGKPYELDWLRKNEIRLKMSDQYPNIVAVDKFPRYLSHIVPEDNVRILDSAKVRMGAQLAAGTVVMPGAAYINFNAGTLGQVMVEGRVSSSVKVGAGSDVGGGASILGVLSGTNGNPVSIGEKCLLGANSVTGVPLGDACVVDAGIAILEGTKVFISEAEREKLAALNPTFKFDRDIYKARELSGLNGLHYRQNSQTGQITASFAARAVKLNENLH